MIPIINMIKGGGSPEQIMLAMLKQQMGNTPMGQNLIQLAQQDNTAQIETIARNIFSQNGKDFDSEFQKFRKELGI